MGCINSTKNKLNTPRRGAIENVFRVRVVRLQPDVRSGWLELTSRELVFVPQASRDEPHVVWALQHLRRYGLNSDVFSFEAGRRCMSGPGIYTFRCQQQESGEQLYQLFQRYVNAVALVTDADAYAERERSAGGDHPSHTLGHLRPGSDALPHSNNYLEPAPLTMSANLRALHHESFSSSPMSLELDSPDSVPSLSFTNEVVHFHHPSSTSGGSAYANTPSATGNVYLEHPLRSVGANNVPVGGGIPAGRGHVVHTEHNNNNHTHSHTGGSMSAGGCSLRSVSKTTIEKLSSLDMPPEECAPILLTPGLATTVVSDALHMYANVEGLGTRSAAEKALAGPLIDHAERCYENLSRLDLPLLLQPSPSSLRDASIGGARETLTPLSAVAAGAVNYIVLDLDQPRSPAQCSPKICFGSGSSLDDRSAADAPTTAAASSELQLLLFPSTTAVTTTTTTTLSLERSETVSEEASSLEQQQQAKTESSLGYSTIDFIRTCALIKSSTHADFDPADHDQESRITRHSKCVRKAYSISE